MTAALQTIAIFGGLALIAFGPLPDNVKAGAGFLILIALCVRHFRHRSRINEKERELSERGVSFVRGSFSRFPYGGMGRFRLLAAENGLWCEDEDACVYSDIVRIFKPRSVTHTWWVNGVRMEGKFSNGNRIFDVSFSSREDLLTFLSHARKNGVPVDPTAEEEFAPSF